MVGKQCKRRDVAGGNAQRKETWTIFGFKFSWNKEMLNIYYDFILTHYFIHTENTLAWEDTVRK
jgi:hypothetical protein